MSEAKARNQHHDPAPLRFIKNNIERYQVPDTSIPSKKITIFLISYAASIQYHCSDCLFFSSFSKPDCCVFVF